jgi:hypothetical protein
MRRETVFSALCGLAALAVGCSLRSLPSSCQVTVNTVTVTNNNIAGIRYATFRVANVGSHSVELVPMFSLENSSGQWRTNFIPDNAQVLHTNMVGVLGFHPGTKVLQAGDSCLVTEPLPFDDLRWRASFFYFYRPTQFEQLLSHIGLANPNDQTLTESTDYNNN